MGERMVLIPDWNGQPAAGGQPVPTMESDMTKINLGAKSGRDLLVEVDFAALMVHEGLVERAVQFAVKQALTNCHAGVKKDEEDAYDKSMALVEKRLEAMMTGNWASAERGPRGDEVSREIRSIAEKVIRGKLKQLGTKVSDLGKGVFSKLVDKQVAAKGESYRATAERAVAERKALLEETEDDFEIDLTDESGDDETEE